MRIRYSLILVLAFLAARDASAQKEANVWYFGRGAGIDFNGAAPVALADGAIDQKEGCASISDASTGELLFYTDGITVWNREHRPMPNGTGLLGHADATQSALIVPAPCAPNLYYVFTADASPYVDPPNDGIHYSIIDIDLDGGRGDVIEKNTLVYAPATEKLTAVRHANGIDWWVVTHEWSSNRYLAWLVSSLGVDLVVPRQSYTGSAHDGASEYASGYLKASPDGQWIASAVTSSNVELFRFNTAVGVLDKERIISTRSKYGLSFSPDSRLLYIVERQAGWSYDSLFQFDLTLGNDPAIVASRTAITHGDFWALQNAPDGRIYIANNSFYLPAHRGWLATIDQPNARGAACGYNEFGFRLDAGGTLPIVNEGLPNMIESFREGLVRACGPPDALIGLDEPICAGSCVSFRDSSKNIPTSWEWRFDGGRPSASSERHPSSVCYDSAGVFNVTLIATNEKGSNTTVRTITVLGASGIRAAAGNVTVTPGDTASVPVTIGSLVNEAPVTEITVQLGYDRRSMRPLGIDADGALLRDWTLTLTDDSASSTVSAHALARPGVTLAGPGRLLSFRFLTYLSTSSTSQMPLSLIVPGNICSTVSGAAGELKLEICGLQQRLVELDTTSLLLRQNQPNPFDRSTRIAFTLPRDCHAIVTVHDAMGRQVAVLHDGATARGRHELVWSSDALPGGVYRCRLEADGSVTSIAMVRMQ